MNDTTTPTAGAGGDTTPRVYHHHHHRNAGIPTNEDFERLALQLELPQAGEHAERELGTAATATTKDNNVLSPPPMTIQHSSVPTSVEFVFDSSSTATGPTATINKPQHKPQQPPPSALHKDKDNHHHHHTHNRKIFSDVTFADMVNNNDQYAIHQTNTGVGDSFVRVPPSLAASYRRPHNEGSLVTVRPVTASLMYKRPPPAAAVQTNNYSVGLNEDSTQTRINAERISAAAAPAASTRTNMTTTTTTTTTNTKLPRLGPRLQDMAKILRRDDCTVQINWEQIERVKYMHERFSQGCLFSFNYNVLLVVASILAALGLVSNSSATIIASMLVSPIMGPVVGTAYAATIQDWSLCKKALKTEFISLFVCIAIGAAVGAGTGWTALAKEWPTSEMVTRGSWTNFLVGLPIAFFSGLGVAVSLLDDQTSSLVGVAISASLLPPAVNSGILWIAYWFQEQDWLGVSIPVQAPEELGKEFPDDDGFELTRQDFTTAGIVSLTLTLANIALIIISSMIMFRCKERLPVEKNIFWYDLGVARKIYRNLAFVSSEEQTRPEEMFPRLPATNDLSDTPISENHNENDLEAQ